MKTKPYLLATAGSTVDGRTISDNDIEEMAKSYNPATYGARLNIEHLRGFDPEGPFRAFGDVLELSTGEVDVDFNGEIEKRKALYGIFDVTPDAKKLNDAGQKVYPSIEIEPNFGGKGFAYMVGCALTDSPAAIATERMKFNRMMPGTIHLSRNESAMLEFEDESGKTTQAGEGLIAKFGTMLDSVFSKHAPKVADTPEPVKTEEGNAFSIADLKPLFEGFAKEIGGSIDTLRTEVRGDLDQFGVRLKAAETAIEGTPAQTYNQRPAAAGAHGDQQLTDC